MQPAYLAVVSGDNGDTQLIAFGVNDSPHELEIEFGHFRGEVEVYGHILGRDSADCDVAGDDVDGKPCGFFDSELVGYVEGVGREDHHLVTKLDDAEIDAILGFDDDGIVFLSEPGVDDSLEEFRVYFPELRKLISFFHGDPFPYMRMRLIITGAF